MTTDDEAIQAASPALWSALSRLGRLFEELVGLHENLIPIRVEEAPLQVGFLTFPFPADSAVAIALEKKVKMLLRAQVGSPSAAMQVVLLRSLVP